MVPEELAARGSGVAGSSVSARSVGLLTDLALIVASAALFSFSFPSVLSDRGWFPLAYISLVPMFLVVRRSGWSTIWLYGALYGFLTYSLFNYWLLNFHPLAIFIVPLIYAVYFLVLFPVLKLADVLFPRYGYLLQVAIWISYEYLRLQGFLGYAYGIIGYSQYLFTPLVQLAAVTGVWGVSALVVFPSAFIAAGVGGGDRGSEAATGNPDGTAAASAGGMRGVVTRLPGFVSGHRWEAVGYALLMVAALAFGLLGGVNHGAAPRWRVAMVQQNIDPWRGGIEAYRDSLDALIRQSEAALAEDPDVVVWSETSFVPAIEYHSRYRPDPEVFELVGELRDYLAAQVVPFVIGNSDAELSRNLEGDLERVDYNAVLLHDDGDFRAVYRKLHLVPFTEHFPYEDTFPWFHQLLVENDTTFWEAGQEYTVFEADGVRFATPICFEDTFGYLSRGFVRRGAEVIVNLTNDGWSYSVPAQMQHMAMAVFRAAENRRSVIRSTNSGMTAVIDPNGRIEAMLDPFVEGYLVHDVPVYTGRTTLYTRFGNWLAWVALLLSAAGLAWGIIRLTAGGGSERINLKGTSHGR